MYKQIYGLIFFRKRRTYICVPCNHIFTDFYLIATMSSSENKPMINIKIYIKKNNNNIITTARESTKSNHIHKNDCDGSTTSTTKEEKKSIKKWKVSTLARTDFHPNMENKKNNTKATMWTKSDKRSERKTYKHQQQQQQHQLQWLIRGNITRATPKKKPER